ncbi:hypothetical protein [Polymorphobacter sp.]|uniref:hypothetical protein n=1 Tax=Polymorphobacter sp. TaxID=1909290 RepID=UPI003F70FDC2
MADELADFVGRLKTDARFRKAFAASPAKTLKAAGIDTSVLALPDKIDEATLVERLERGGVPAGTSLKGLDPQTLWDKFGIIGWKTQPGASAAGNTSIAAVTVVYGVAVVVGTNVVVVGKDFVASVGQLRVMRQMARLDAADLRFSIKGPDGVSIDDVPVDAVRAFIDRVKAPGR